MFFSLATEVFKKQEIKEKKPNKIEKRCVQLASNPIKYCPIL